MRPFALVVAALAALAVAAGPLGAAGPRGAALTRADLRGVNFVSSCGFSHRAMDDPIVFSGAPGRSHDHSFVANRTTSAFSTLASLRAGATTCRNRPGDTAAYWMPTLLDGATAVEPRGATIYYRRHTLARVRPFPQGLKMIAGNARATEAQSLRVTFWNCGPQSMVERSSTVPACPGGREGVRLHVSFPDCWDGRSLDSADHQSHMAYSMQARCPASHPVALPAISLIYRFDVAGSPALALASGGQLTAHADFVNAWQPAALARLVNGCLNALRHCGQGS